MFSKFREKASYKKGLEILNAYYDLAVKDSDMSPTAIEISTEYMKKNNNDVKKAAEELIDSQETICDDIDCLKAIGRNMNTHIAIPYDVSGNLFIQTRMITALAIMGGYDPEDLLIKTLVFITLVGMSSVSISKQMGIFIGSKTTVEAVQKCSEKMLGELCLATGKRLVMVLDHDVIKVVPNAPSYDSVLVEPFDRKSVRKVAKRATDLFLK